MFSGEARFDFSKECQIQSSSLTVMVTAEEEFAFQQMDEPRLIKGEGSADELVGQGDTELFAQRFGQYFIRGVQTGGRFVGVVRIDTNSNKSKTAVNAALSGHYGLTVDGNVKVDLTETLSTAEATVAAFVHSEGGTVTTKPHSEDPVELLKELYAAMDEWTKSVKDEAKSYLVTIHPWVIALGPKPPNAAEVEHQRDVLIRCAKLRSQTMDKLNLLDYILDPQHTAEFDIVAPPDGPDLPALQATFASDLEAIADTATFALNNLKEACDPETFMRTKHDPLVPDFHLTPLPNNMPNHTGGAPTIRHVVVPHFNDCNSFAECEARARQSGLVPTFNILAIGTGSKFKSVVFLDESDPLPGTAVDEGTTVRINIIPEFELDIHL